MRTNVKPGHDYEAKLQEVAALLDHCRAVWVQEGVVAVSRDSHRVNGMPETT